MDEKQRIFENTKFKHFRVIENAVCSYLVTLLYVYSLMSLKKYADLSNRLIWLIPN